MARESPPTNSTVAPHSAQPANLPPGRRRPARGCAWLAPSVRACNAESIPARAGGAYTDLEAFSRRQPAEHWSWSCRFLDRQIARAEQPGAMAPRPAHHRHHAFSRRTSSASYNATACTLRAPVALDHIWQQCQLAQSRKVDWQPPEWNPKAASSEPVPPRGVSTVNS